MSKKTLLLVPVLLLVLAGCTPAPSPTTVTVSITGGLDTDAADNGRPVVLIAAALGVPTEVFRDAFSGVHPDSEGDGPTPAEAQANKAVLLSVLGPYGITNSQLDAVSDHYRYLDSAGQEWPHEDARAEAVLTNGVVTSIRVLDGGSGYTSAPTITLSTGQTATAELAFGTDVDTNGSISSITVTP